ncbi:thioester domain-containing protein [Nocardiopsis halotolerans]|uniref:thioester domain-containing protein n=1 Tax=Nocardiopsis halotolerans TaxID=124252 RepID=UPI0003453C88|nr:thioester domain-containing protein [Nocardiopsis halotolerans]
MSGILRRCAALLASAALVGPLLGAPSASADDFSRVDRDPIEGAALVLADGQETGTALFSLRVSNQTSVRAYTATADGEVRPHTAYVESAWSNSTEWTETLGETDPVDRANWIVANSYPAVELLPLTEGTDLLGVVEGQAIAATQAALWHVLDGVELDRAANDPVVLALYDHLVEGSETAADDTTSRSLGVSPAHVEEVAPTEPLGPLTVHSSGTGPVSVSVRGAPSSWLVNEAGEQVTRVGDGDQVFLEVDPSVPAGVATLRLRGQDLPLPEGRLFTGRNGARTQSLVTAEAGSATRSATATLTWLAEESPEPEAERTPGSVPVEEPEPTLGEAAPEESPEAETSPEEVDRNSEDGLALTGTWLSGLLVIAGALVVSGLIILVLGRKRRD